MPLRVFVNNSFKESFYGKKKKFLTVIFLFFLIFHKSGVKAFLKWIVNQCLKGTC